MPSNSEFLSQEVSREATAKQLTPALIESVKSRPMLWDRNDKDYKKAARKTAVWELVANESGFKDGPAAMAKWNYLRGEYGKQKKKLPGGSDDITWRFFNSMQFLDATSEEPASDAPDSVISPIPVQDAASTSERTARMNKRKLVSSDAPERFSPIPIQDVASTSETTFMIAKRKLDPEFENETIETQIKQEKLRNLRLSNRLLELQIIEKERELGVSRQAEKGIQCDEWTTLIGQILR
ncbi:alcohol dehydrogenase transcription factor myb/SANT-like domain-containing protein [Ditylenchus destructor]|uniref:Alcohol dehydrogenase transcription factor myb/SANT-like domain-containing protein n=1 Tax=Ditylenchus destructor TaxID=166010 RepID=A0AAD4QW32_9BILA|nr:alcohol dehydrogenase transcription factor myb/SANT-like domain-containing protein [Ditylenchus destructor]